ILATVGGDTLAAYWAAGDAPGDTVSAGVATFGGPRLLFNIDNDPNAGNNGINDLANMSPAGLNAMISAIDFATPLTSVPEPSSALLSLVALGFLARRRR
ncbi:PEP-CTERM sorting domain-containing protein, partial [Akkermansiaceae bacterium]|nr:PEP-CTERM sorting domain-containing protein [Akkermansiaceae bacterium]